MRLSSTFERYSRESVPERFLKSRYPVEPFERQAEDYDQSVTSAQGWPHAGYGDVLGEVVRQAEARAGMTILDLGVGTGNLVQRFDALGCHVVGIDFSPKMLAEARKKLPRSVLIHAGLLDEWPEITGRFDRVVSSYALHHFDLETKMHLLSRMNQDYLSENGFMVIADIAFPTSRHRDEAREHLGDRWEAEEHYWAADETRAKLEKIGLSGTFRQVSTYGGVLTVKRARRRAG